VLAIGATALPGAPLERPLGVSEASAARKVTQLVFNQDRTIRPRGSVPTKVFCPGRFIPFTWGFRPINPPIPGVAVNAILTSVVPDEKGTKKAGFTITLFNPNPGATVQIRISTTCVEGSGGLGTRFRAAAAKGSKPTLALDSESEKVEIPAGRRVAASVSCDRRTNAAIADVGFDSERSEYVGFLPTERRGRPAARVVIQNRTTAGDSGRVYANCIEGRGFKVSEKTVDAGGIAAAGKGRRASVAGGAGAGGKPGLLFERTRFTGTADPFGAATLVVRCGDPLPAPTIRAIGGGASALIGPETGPALEQFVFAREAVILSEAGVAVRRDPRGFPLADPAGPSPNGTLLQLTLFGLLNLTGQPAAVTKTPVCAKSIGNVRTLVDPDSDVEE
jgi:hypothetical protein